MTMHDGKIPLLHLTPFPEPGQFARHERTLGHDNHSARLAIQTIDEMRRRAFSQIKSNPADEAGVGIALGGMTDQIRRFVDGEHLVILEEHFKQFFH